MNRRAWVAALAIALAIVGRVYVRATEPGSPQDLAKLPRVLDGWIGSEGPPLHPSEVSVLRADDYATRIYTRGAERLGLFVAYYRSQRFGSAMHSPLNCLPGAGWRPIGVERIRFGNRGSIRRLTIEKGEQRSVVLFWYQSASRIEGEELRSKMYMVLDTLRSRRSDAALVRIVAPVDSAREDGGAVAEHGAFEFARLAEPEIRELLFQR